jgi:RimJ/RimL family protein N-acetyltransferase
MIHPENQASVKVAQNIGMVLEKEMEDELGPYLLFSRVEGDSDASPTL